MTEREKASLGALEAAYGAYAEGFVAAAESEVRRDMLELKREHTRRVVENARAIMAGEGFAERERFLGEAAALLHDTGRYEQITRYGTFNDLESEDHARLSRRIVEGQGWLDGWAAADRAAVLAAVEVHNRREIPAEMAGTELRVARLVRDADKLDIFRVLEERFTGRDWEAHPEYFWNLEVRRAPSPAVAEAILAGRAVSYGAQGSLADFVLLQAGWMLNGLEFATTRRLTRERGHLEFREGVVAELSGGRMPGDAARVFERVREKWAKEGT